MIGDEGVEALGKALKTNPILENVNLQKNKITGLGVLSLFNSLTTRPNKSKYSALTLKMDDNTLELKDMYNVLVLEDSSSEALSQIKPRDSENLPDLGLFCENSNLYCKTHDQEKMQIMRSATQGLDPVIFDNILSIMNGSATEGQQDSANLQLPFERIRPFEEKLLQYTSMIGYTPLIDGFSQNWTVFIESLKAVKVTVNFTASPRPIAQVGDDDSE